MYKMIVHLKKYVPERKVQESASSGVVSVQEYKLMH